MGHPEITIAICTYNRSDALERCLDALAAQTCAATRFEVLVVDNASTDDTPTVVRRFAHKFSMFKYAQEPVQGLARARNRALSQCQSEILGFTDDDAIPNPDWVATILETFRGLPESYAAIGGEIEPIWERERPQWLDDKMLRTLGARLGWDTNERELEPDEWICEVNCAYRTKALSRYGGFPENLGRKGDLLLSGENYVNEHMRQDGCRFYFNPAVLVRHCIPKARTTQTWFKRRYLWQGVTGAACAAFDRSLGRTPRYWGSLQLPGCADDWRLLIEDNLSAPEFQRACAMLSSIGYLLALKNVVSGR
jgi:glycosyltransferase involved in cell wall biosynthesis